MKAKLPPLVLSTPRQVCAAPRTHQHATHAVKNKSVDRSSEKESGPRSTEDSKADGSSFREALFGPSASDQEAALAMSGGFGEGGGQSQGQGGQQQDERGGRRSKGAASSSRRQKDADSTESASELAQSSTLSAEGWMELELESRVAGKIRLSVLKEEGLLRARVVVGNPLAADWMREHLASVEKQLAEELGCRVKLEMK